MKNLSKPAKNANTGPGDDRVAVQIQKAADEALAFARYIRKCERRPDRVKRADAALMALRIRWARERFNIDDDPLATATAEWLLYEASPSDWRNVAKAFEEIGKVKNAIHSDLLVSYRSARAYAREAGYELPTFEEVKKEFERSGKYIVVNGEMLADAEEREKFEREGKRIVSEQGARGILDLHRCSLRRDKVGRPRNRQQNSSDQVV